MDAFGIRQLRGNHAAAFYDADLVISKGMGNFEVLVDGCGREDVYFLLMTKCGHVASLVDAPLMSFVCKRG